MKKIIFLLLTLPFLFISCEKDNLTNEYDRFEGKYQWVYSSYVTRNCVLCQLNHHTDYATEANYTAQIEFDNTSNVTFLIDNTELTKKRFSIKDQYQDGNTLYMDLRVDVNKNVLDIDDRLEVYGTSQDTIYITGFPGSGYDSEFKGENYFVRIK